MTDKETNSIIEITDKNNLSSTNYNIGKLHTNDNNRNDSKNDSNSNSEKTKPMIRQLKDIDYIDDTETNTNYTVDYNNNDKEGYDYIKNNKKNKTSFNSFDNIYITNKPFKIGNVYTLLWIKNTPIICIGPHWPFFFVLYSCITVISYMYFYLLRNTMHETPRDNSKYLLFVYWIS